MKKQIILAVLCMIALVIVCDSIYVQDMVTQSVVTRMGDPVNINKVPGVAFKTPIIEHRYTYDNRWYEWDGAPMELPTLDRKYVAISVFGRWKIVNPLLFKNAVGNTEQCFSRLDDIFDGKVNDLISANMLNEAVRTSNRVMLIASVSESDSVIISVASADSAKVRVGRDSMLVQIMKLTKPSTDSLGIEFANLNFRTLMYTKNNLQGVYDRMISDQNRVAELYTSKGNGLAMEIVGKKDREIAIIRSEAYRQAKEFHAKGEGEAAAIYSSAYGQYPEFYSFMRSLRTLEETIDENTNIVLSTGEGPLRGFKLTK
ncbi:MAG TPA: protease modulator HflC [Bacteroidales bacterium]|nr:protease modulator HflC [Bacteroidales bacterium]